MPWEILHAGAYLRVGVYGVDGNKTMPTVYSGQMFVARGAEPSETAREHSPDVFDQIVEIGGQVAEDAESAAGSASAAAASADAAQSAQTGAETAQTAAENAQEAAGALASAAAAYAANAAGSATSAALSAQAASAAQDAAKTAKTDAQTAASAAAGSAQNAATSESNAYTYQQGAKEYRDETEEMLDDLVKYDNDEFASPLPFNADRLNGHPDIYFAKQEDMSAAEQSIADNTAARHTHANKSVLDQITQAMLDLIGTIAQKYSATNPPPYPVKSVNGQTGGVVLNYITFDEEES